MLTDPLARQFINRFQGGFPVRGRPFRFVAEVLGARETTLIPLVRSLVDAGWLSRFGPLFNAERMGGAHTLAALEVPEERFDDIASLVNAFDAVSHNYRREHRLNMWFVVSAEQGAGVRETLDAISAATGLVVYDFPKLREFRLGLFLHLDDDGCADTVPGADPPAAANFSIDAADRELVVATQRGLPIESEPYARIARRIGRDEAWVMARLLRMIDAGVIRRIGVVPNHYQLGLRANGMTVWDVSDADVAQAGREVGALPFVSHCYTRPRHARMWPYNLFAMVHGATRATVEDKRARIEALLGVRCRRHDVLVSNACLKKTGLRLAA